MDGLKFIGIQMSGTGLTSGGKFVWERKYRNVVRVGLAMCLEGLAKSQGLGQVGRRVRGELFCPAAP